jgi:hypothetical protein
MEYAYKKINFRSKKGDVFMAEDIHVDIATAMTIECQRFDKKIAEAEAQVADLKRQKASYIFDTNIQQLLTQKKIRDSQQST